MAIVLLGGLRWLKPETTLAEIGSRAEVVKCLCLKPCCQERVPSASTMVGRRSRSRIFAAGQRRIFAARQVLTVIGMYLAGLRGSLFLNLLVIEDYGTSLIS